MISELQEFVLELILVTDPFLLVFHVNRIIIVSSPIRIPFAMTRRNVTVPIKRKSQLTVRLQQQAAHRVPSNVVRLAFVLAGTLCVTDGQTAVMLPTKSVRLSDAAKSRTIVRKSRSDAR